MIVAQTGKGKTILGFSSVLNLNSSLFNLCVSVPVWWTFTEQC